MLRIGNSFQFPIRAHLTYFPFHQRYAEIGHTFPTYKPSLPQPIALQAPHSVLPMTG
jgi:hypothetical protein